MQKMRGKNIPENCCEFMWHKEKFKGESGALETRPKNIVNDSKDKGKLASFKSFFGLNFYTLFMTRKPSEHGNCFSDNWKFEWKETCAIH